jgi:hypothetical protein
VVRARRPGRWHVRLQPKEDEIPDLERTF